MKKPYRTDSLNHLSEHDLEPNKASKFYLKDIAFAKSALKIVLVGATRWSVSWPVPSAFAFCAAAHARPPTRKDGDLTSPIPHCHPSPNAEDGTPVAD
ncbi:hypothetical protein CEP52_000499 [Fusarium oligoseptatum]|uniref:Uncharacterized protein n=1 Tax=Fusarium oligoseptatum TaxID=2604345 RepID=A0A428UNP6_9HYPO|nr:hypothetical protein CEP52_000499 [Fusarium oligoseptatum]